MEATKVLLVVLIVLAAGLTGYMVSDAGNDSNDVPDDYDAVLTDYCLNIMESNDSYREENWELFNCDNFVYGESS